MNTRIALLVMHTCFATACFAQAAQPPTTAPAANIQALRTFIAQEGEKPAEYVVRQFQTHDIVFLGEHHYLKHDVQFVQSMIPALYENGIRNLGIEFGCWRDQARVDGLLSAPTYDEQSARELMFDCYVLWGYREYTDLYRAAWKLNASLPKDQPRFRIVHLNAESDWSQLTRDTPRMLAMQKVWPHGFSDEVMARVILDEFVAKEQKALIYCGVRHGATRYDERPPRSRALMPARAGRAVYQKIGQRTCTICLHAPWKQQAGGYAPPADGIIDAVIGGGAMFPIAFDTRGTPMGKLQDRACYYAQDREGFALEDLCDGYVYLKPLDQFEMVTVDEQFVTEKNLNRAIRQLPDLDDRARCKSVADVLRLIRDQAESAVRPGPTGNHP